MSTIKAFVNKLEISDPNFVTETGDAYGIDFSLRYEKGDFFAWDTYSLAKVTRFDGEQTYPTIFDRRHNVNLLAVYQMGEDKSWEAAVRWNYGSGLPFTLTQGFYNKIDFGDGLDTDPKTTNGNLGVVLDDQRNGGRLPDYHRLDISLKKTMKFGRYTSLEAVASATNAYSRDNIFYFDRFRNKRVNQLPILPSLGLTLNF